MGNMTYVWWIATAILFFSKQIGMQAYHECEELKNCRLTYNISGDIDWDTTYTWRINITDVSSCFARECHTYTYFINFTKAYTMKYDKQTSFIVELPSVRREKLEFYGNHWTLTDKKSNVFFETYLLIKVNPKQLNCTYKAITEGLSIDCIGSRSYPESRCNFSLIYNGSKADDLVSVQYNHTKVSLNPEYYITECTATMPISNIRTGLYEFYVVISPNTTTLQCEDCGKTAVKVNIEKPDIVLGNCSMRVLEGTRVDCPCSRVDKSDIATRIVWYQESMLLQQDTDTSVLTSKVTSNAQTYTCIAVNAFGWRINKTYKPDIIYQSDLENPGCPSDRPHLCLPHRICYSNDEFCVEGKVESCFPIDVEKSELSSWCETKGQFNVSLMRNRACHGACASRFGSVIITKNSVTSDMLDVFYLGLCIFVAVVLINILGILVWWRFGKSIILRCNSHFERFKICRKTLDANVQKKLHLEEWNACENSHNHKDLILCTDYNRDPKKYIKKLEKEDQDLIEKIRKCIDSHIILTVRLFVKQKSHFSYVGSNDGSYSGTGFVVKVKPTDIPCKCPKSPNSGRHDCWCVYVSTSTHVVANEQEANSTTAELFYNDDFQTGVKEVYGVGIYQFTNDESVIIQCVTCEKDVYAQLSTTLIKFEETLQTFNCNNNYAVVVSHPHGRPKCISFGTYTETDTGCRINYNAATCKGSEGAAVLTLNSSCKQWLTKMITANFVIHSGVNNRKRNFSGLAYVNFSKEDDALTMPLRGRDTEVDHNNDNNEINSQQDSCFVKLEATADIEGAMDATCQKDPKDIGHLRFIQVNKFSVDNLPPEYQSETVFDYIKNVAYLTGKIYVNFTSSNRPDFIDDTRVPYPGSSVRGKSSLRFGSAVVVSVIEIKEKNSTSYQCPICQQFDWPCKVFYLVYVLTAKHIVFDDSEAEQSAVSFRFDLDSSPVLTVSGGRIVESEMEFGTSVIEYVTHDTRIAQMSESLKTLYKLERKIDAGFEVKKDQSLAVIVSHPHGLSKRISTGYWLERELTISKSGTFVRYTYTTATCPGSSGAPVFIPGEGVQRVFKQLCLPHVHKETGKDGRGVSCLGVKSFRVVKSKSE